MRLRGGTYYYHYAGVSGKEMFLVECSDINGKKKVIGLSKLHLFHY